jgi:hypothetical protein
VTVVRLIKDGVLPAKQSCVGAPYVIQEIDLDLQAVRHATGQTLDSAVLFRVPLDRTAAGSRSHGQLDG